MANHNDRILRFHVADKVFHGLNAILWFALVITGAIVYLAKPEAATGESLMAWHVGLGIVFTLNLVGYLLFAPERFALMINACLIWDKNTILWFRNFGGYPRRFFKIPFGPVEVTPQGRYNAGQKASYLLFTAAIVMLIVTGWLLWVFAPAIGKDAFLSMWYLHVWGSLFITVLVVCAHIPLALLSMSHFLGIWRIGTGDISWEAAEHHSPVWLEKDVIRGLKSAAGYLRRELGANMSLRYTPELQFIADDSIEYGAHILEMLRDPRVVKPANPENETRNTEDEQE